MPVFPNLGKVTAPKIREMLHGDPPFAAPTRPVATLTQVVPVPREIRTMLESVPRPPVLISLRGRTLQ